MVYYHELSRILGDTSATGKLAFPSTKSPCESSASSDPEFKVKNEELDSLQIDSDNENGDGQGKGKGKGKGKSKMGGEKSKKRSSFQANISETLKEMSENSKRKVDLMEKRFTSASVTNVGDDSGSIEGGSTPSRSLLKECMALLHGMEEIPAAAYTKAVNKLTSDPIMREEALSTLYHCILNTALQGIDLSSFAEILELLTGEFEISFNTNQTLASITKACL
ncbi:hypothetical protein TEA_020215 [Camellia sinensis var. sinensis]|uniref:Uncharacterized protein n=1 Tax=Camellia sinensis var. sinensis TaxID=542762 RepID=A0A4S4F1D2_CAMSN|nr:hypothetical protein TEA_020215 [Camellia sinensis var. sinensis]